MIHAPKAGFQSQFLKVLDVFSVFCRILSGDSLAVKMARETLVANSAPSATHYVYLTKGVLLGRTELVDSLGSHALAGMAPATAVWAELHDTYGVVGRGPGACSSENS